MRLYIPPNDANEEYKGRNDCERNDYGWFLVAIFRTEKFSFCTEKM